MAVARPLSDLPKFLGAIAVQSKDAAAEASNRAALVVVRSIRAELPTRRLNARARSGGKRTGTGVNYGYREADPDKARYQPTALVVGRGPVHILENSIKPHFMVRGVRRDERGRISDIVPINAGGIRRRYSTIGTIRTYHPGVRRSSGPFRRGVARASTSATRTWTRVFANESLRVKGF